MEIGQVNEIMKVLNLDKYIYITCFISCYLTDLTETLFLEEILKHDIIITQNINDNYRNKNYLQTSFIANNVKNTTQIILFDSCWFDFYYTDAIPTIYNIPYHFNYMISLL